MSFFEDNVEDGSHCMACCELIGENVGYHRFYEGQAALTSNCKQPHEALDRQGFF